MKTFTIIIRSNIKMMEKAQKTRMMNSIENKDVITKIMMQKAIMNFNKIIDKVS
jgi:hypothetical protein